MEYTTSGVIMNFDLTPRPDYDYLSANPHYILALKIVTGVSSGLSLFGALTVIFFHVFFSELWPSTVVRHIVVMLSIADLLVAVSHIWGATQPLENFMEAYHHNGSNFSSSDIQCTAQAVLAVVGTLASFLWTLALVSYVLIVTAMPGKVAVWCQKSAVVALYSVLCWGFPLVLTIVLGRLKLLGYAESVDLGWCYVSFSSGSQPTIHPHHFELMLSYELWTWIIIGAIILCVIAYVTVHCCKKNCGLCTGKLPTDIHASYEQGSDAPLTHPRRLDGSDDIRKSQHLTSSASGSNDEWTAIQTSDANQRASLNVRQPTSINCRPVLAGVLLLGLRSLSTAVDAALMLNHKKYYHADWLAFMVLFAAIGDSLQGFVNMFLFVWCTPQVYSKCSCCRCNCACRSCCKKQAGYERLK